MPTVAMLSLLLSTAGLSTGCCLVKGVVETVVSLVMLDLGGGMGFFRTTFGGTGGGGAEGTETLFDCLTWDICGSMQLWTGDMAISPIPESSALPSKELPGLELVKELIRSGH